MAHKLVDKILDLKKAFIREHRRDPTVVHLDLDDELDLSMLTGHFSQDTINKINAQGARAAVDKLAGMSVEWDADVSFVE